MSELVDAKGLACPEPVILTKKALDAHDEVTVLVDNATALENVKRLASVSGCAVEVAEEPGGIFRIDIKKGQGSRARAMHHPNARAPKRAARPARTYHIRDRVTRHGARQRRAGRPSHESLHPHRRRPGTPARHDDLLQHGGNARGADSGAVDDLKALEEKGVKILVCGTCVNFFDLGGKTRRGDRIEYVRHRGRLVDGGKDRQAMSEDKTYWVALFDSVSHVMKAEKILREADIPYKIIPVPKSISTDCGVCVRFLSGQKETVAEALRLHVHVSEMRELQR